MKNLLFLAVSASIFLSGCIKEPTACISGPTSLKVFESGTFISCSEEAESVEWTIPTNGFLGFITETKSTNLSVSHYWSAPQDYHVELIAFSKEQKKRDLADHVVTVTDICYECISAIYNNSVIDVCAYEDGFYSREDLENYIAQLEEGGYYTCTEK